MMLRLSQPIPEKVRWARNFEHFAAWALALGGCFWAGLLVIGTMFSFVILTPPFGFLLIFVFLPGWSIFAGWWSVARRVRLPVPKVWFWSLSAIWNLGIASLGFQEFVDSLTSGKYEEAPNALLIWLLFAGGLSLACALLSGLTSYQQSDLR